MKYTIEIDTSSKTGAEVMNYVRKFKGKSVSIRKSSRNGFTPLTPEELALPMGKKPTKAQLREYFDRKPGKTIDIEVVRKKALTRLNQKAK